MATFLLMKCTDKKLLKEFRALVPTFLSSRHPATANRWWTDTFKGVNH